MKPIFKILLGLLILVIVGVAAVAAATPWMDRWGATNAEIVADFPGDELLANPASIVNRAITIHASPEQIYPWNLQLGAGRGGFYSYSWLETNLLRCTLVNANYIHPEWQNLQIGDLVRMCPGETGPAPYTVARLVMNQAVVLGHMENGQWVDLWLFVIVPQADGSSRLILRSRTNMAGGIWAVIHPGIFIMERGMLNGIKERAEGLPLAEVFPPTPSPLPTEEATTTPEVFIHVPTEEVTTTPEIFNPAPVEAVIGDKARTDISTRTGLEVASISVVEIKPQAWPDSCLGLAPETGKECAKGPVSGFRVLLNASGHPFEYRATADGKLITFSGPVALGFPEACAVPDTSVVFSPEDGYCFSYPVRFHRIDDLYPINVLGPVYGPGPEPLSAALKVEISRPGSNLTLDAAVDAFLQGLGTVALPQTREAITVNGEKGILLEVVPGKPGSRDVFMMHQGMLFHLTFFPAPSAAAETAADVTDLYQTVIASFHFLP